MELCFLFKTVIDIYIFPNMYRLPINFVSQMPTVHLLPCRWRHILSLCIIKCLNLSCKLK
ncbi:unnamed protein product [Brassica oleracea var. botrytis]|uniref:(rape) hypothetical protein n=1 Tax=Brassica napus TaxID=3708 RepID=A0A816M1T0_BRANA|nr:unnamed protein product [Brassica napus]